MRNLFQFLSILLLVALAACTNEDDGLVVDDEVEEVPVEEVTFDLTSTESRAAADILAFNQDFFKAVVASHADQSNVVCSPLSASVLLSMVANAADGEVRNEITKALGCSDLKGLNSLNQKFLLALPNADEFVTFTSANSVWYDQQYTIVPDFASISKKYYDAPNFGCDFRNGANVVKEINNWCSEKTNGIIDQMLYSLPANVQAVLVNAIYFKGSWAVPFKIEETSEMQFYGSKGYKDITMMHRTCHQNYLSSKNFEAVKLQIGDNRFEAFFILPKTDINEFISTVDFESIASTEFDAKYISYFVPKFKHNPASPLMLNASLERMGITSLTTPCDLSMFTTKLESVHEIIQSTGIEFTEEGAEGASVSMDIPASSNMDPWGRVVDAEVKFDRPFVFMIRETTTGALLFAGKISDL
ncbi:MAG: serpin family protein [Bacteroidales bacterium]|nr:serpin family protein [Bacteroidales bacterium]